MTVGAIQFDAMFSGADALCVADTSGLTPLSFNPPSSDALGRFLSSMSGDKSAVDSIRLALGSIAQNMSSPRDVSKPVVAPVAAGSRPAAIVGKPVVESPDTYCCSTLVVEKPVVAPIAPVAPTTPTAPVAPVIEPLVAEKPVVEKPVVESPDTSCCSTLVVEKPVVEAPIAPTAPVAPTTPTAPVAPVVEPLVAEKPVVEKPVVEAPVAPVAPDSRPVAVATVQVTPAASVATPVVELPVAPDSRPATIAAAQVTPAAPVATPAVEPQVAPVAPDSRPATIAAAQVTPAAPVATPVVESPVAPAAPVDKSTVVESPAAPVVEAPVAKSEVASAKPVVAGKRTAAPEEVVVIDLSQESARAAAPLREAPFVAAAQQEIAASTASARTESIIEVVNNVAEAIADQILVTPSLVRGEGQMIVRLKPEVLDGSEIHLSSESGTLAVEIVPSTQNAAKLATEAMPRLETALAEHVATFRQVSVSVRKGKVNETV